jgi:hypothetical protein
MADFAKAFVKGIEAHNDTARVRTEIARVFTALSREVFSASKGGVMIGLSPRTRGGIKLGPAVVMTAEGPVDVRAYHASKNPLSAEIPADAFNTGSSFVLFACSGATTAERLELAEIELGERGYPMRLSYPRHEDVCADRVGLERALKELLETPHAGAIFQRLLSPALPAPSNDAH